MSHIYNHIRDKIDVRDYKLQLPRRVLTALPKQVDLRPMMPNVYDQGKLGSCGLNAGAAAHEFCQRKATGKLSSFTPSRLQWYYDVRKFYGMLGEDSGVMLRDVMKSGVATGICPETMWPYDIDKFTERPPGSCYLEAEKHQIEMYHSVHQTPDQAKGCLAQGFPFVLGIQIYESFESKTVEESGIVPMPKKGWFRSERLLGGHAVLAVGYNDFAGRFIIRNSWGERWGDKGYGFIPYDYIFNTDLTSDMWTVRIVENP